MTYIFLLIRMGRLSEKETERSRVCRYADSKLKNTRLTCWGVCCSATWLRFWLKVKRHKTQRSHMHEKEHEMCLFQSFNGEQWIFPHRQIQFPDTAYTRDYTQYYNVPVANKWNFRTIFQLLRRDKLMFWLLRVFFIFRCFLFRFNFILILFHRYNGLLFFYFTSLPQSILSLSCIATCHLCWMCVEVFSRIFIHS